MTFSIFGIVAAVVAVYAAMKYFQNWLLQRKLWRWSSTPKDVIILHGLPRARTLPTISPFVLKLETFFRMAGLRYEFDSSDPFGPKGKTPWITINGEHFTDSQLIIQMLIKRLTLKTYDDTYTAENLALAKVFRIMLEEHFFWAWDLERFVYNGAQFAKVGGGSTIWPNPLLFQFAAHWIVRFESYWQGIGRHTQADVESLGTGDLQALSAFLGGKKFVLGDEPCVDDCAIFGQLAQVYWGLPCSKYEVLLRGGEFKNLGGYCERMKERFWADWEIFLKK